MAGRNDFGVLRTEFLADARAHRAAELWTERLGVPEDLALSSVIGTWVSVGVWAMRETDAGTLPGDGVAAVHAATLMPRSVCRTAVSILTDVGLLAPSPGGLAIAEFAAWYRPILARRAQNRESAAAARAAARKPIRSQRRKKARNGAKQPQRQRDGDKAATPQNADVDAASAPRPPDVPPTSAPRHADVLPHRTVPDRTEGLPPTPSPVPEQPIADRTPLTPSERAAAAVIASAIRTTELRLPDPPELAGPIAELADVERRRQAAWRRGGSDHGLEAESRRLAESIAAGRRAHRQAVCERLRLGGSDARSIVEQYRTSEVLTGPTGCRVPLRVACLAAAREARASAREIRRAGAETAAVEPQRELAGA